MPIDNPCREHIYIELIAGTWGFIHFPMFERAQFDSLAEVTAWLQEKRAKRVYDLHYQDISGTWEIEVENVS